MFMKAKIVAWNGERGIAYDYLDIPIYFTKDQVHPQDLLLIDVGMDILVSGSSVEIASNSFSRWMEENSAVVGSAAWKRYY